MASCLISAIVLMVCVCVVAGGVPLYETYDMINKCHGRMYGGEDLHHGALVYSMIRSRYQEGFCQIILASGSLDAILFVNAEKMSLGTTGACIQLWDGGGTHDPPTGTPAQYCKNELFQFSTTQQYLTINLTTASSTNGVGFRLVVTPIFKECDFRSFQCDNGDCIHSDLVGDGHQNCLDYSDEKGSSTSPCGVNMLSCNSSEKCIPISWKCDQFSDCQNSTDEQNCRNKCPESKGGYDTRWACQDGNGCYSRYDRCNNYRTCNDGSDEMDCDDCGETEYAGMDYQDYSEYRNYCPVTRTCLQSEQICDGIEDCPDGMDEDFEKCHPSIYWYWSGGQLAGLFIGYILFFIIVIAVVAVVHKKCRKHVV